MSLSLENSDLFPETTAAGLSARLVALDLLRQVLQQKKQLDLILERDEAYRDLEGRDRAFVRLLVTTVLRRKGQLDQAVRSFLDEPDKLDSPGVWLVLYLALAQIIFLKTPAHAVVNTSVDLAKNSPLCPGRYKGLINAVLRRASQAKITLCDEKNNIPSWLFENWVQDFGEEIANQIVHAGLTEACLDLTIKDCVDEWAMELGGAVLSTGSVRLSTGGKVNDLSGFHEGRWWVQDAAAAIPAKLLGFDLTEKTIVDLCAAPGGKTAQLALAGATVLAVDRSSGRMRRLAENQKRLNFDVEKIMADGAVWQPTEKVDGVLVDAPCSATGTLRRHPDLLHLKEERDIERLTDLQRKLLLNAADMVKPGGQIVYCTCSLQKAEGENQVSWFLDARPDFSLSPIVSKEVGGLDEIITSESTIRTFPFHLQEQGGLDGFFVARFQRLK